MVEYSALGNCAAISGDYSVVDGPPRFQWNADLSELTIVDLKSKKIIRTITLPKGFPAGFDIYGDILVWSDYRNEKQDLTSVQEKGIACDNADIFICNLKTGEIKQITKNTASQISPCIWKNYIVWQDARNYPLQSYYGKWDIYLYDLNTGKEKCIVSAGGYSTRPKISDYKIVWQDGRNFKGNEIYRGGDNVPENNTDIYMYDIRTGKEKAIASGPLQECNPDVSGNYIVWEDRNNGSGNADIFLYDLIANKKRQITNERHNQANPKILGNYIAWMDERNGGASSDVYENGQTPNADIYLYDLTTGREKRMTGHMVQIMPILSENWLAFVRSTPIAPLVQVEKLK